MRVELAPNIEMRLRNALRKAGSREIGGMLFAEQLAPARFRIVDFLLRFAFGVACQFSA